MGPGPNAEHIQCWNDILEPKFSRFRDVMTEGFRAHSDCVLGEHGPSPGDRVIDVGCGWGDTTLMLARRVGPTGSVLGIDCVDKFLEHGREAAAREGLDHVRFVCGDAQTHAFEPGHDLVFARFGTMFFANPAAAMRNLGRAVRPGGRLAMIVWRALEENEWLAHAKRIALEHLPPPGDQAQTCGPGPFSMADPETVRGILAAAGWADPEWTRIDVPLRLGPLDDALTLQVLIGPAGEIVREAGELGEEKRDAILAELREQMARHVDARGDVVMQAASWCVRARRPS